MEYIIIVIVALSILSTIAFILRRRHFQQIGKLELEKQQIQHKPILEEMTKVKQLNMTGETEEKFERWRNEWTEVMDVHMPKIDSLLFDAEDYVDHFRYKKSTATQQQIAQLIEQCDEKMNNILHELNELVGSEEKNRIEMEQLMEQHRAARKTLLAHQHSFGRTADPLEKELDYFSEKFHEYEEMTRNGNYLLARENVIALRARGEKVFSLVHEIPTMLSELQNKIPASIRELRNGIREMEDQSYYLQHLELDSHLTSIEKEIEGMLEQMTSLEIESIRSRTIEINDMIDSFYDALENEVNAKRYIEEMYESTKERLSAITTTTREVSDEAEFVQQSYRLDEKESKIPKLSLQTLEQLEDRFTLLTERLEEHQSAYSSLEEELKSISTELDRIDVEQTQFAERMKNLRIDENRARTKLDEFAKILQEADRKLHKGNIPGIPDDMEARLEEADEQLYIVTQSLQEVPLNMKLVDSYLGNAEKSVMDVSERVDELLENVMLIEWIIQYGNRYRASNPHVHARLLEAEELFRQYRYAKALEEAATAVEEVEPGAMKRIEELVKEHA